MATPKKGDLLRGDHPQIFYFNGTRRRWVPDGATLSALAPRGQAAVKRVSQKVLAGIPRGAALPPLADGTLLIQPDLVAYLSKAGRLHLVPDPETLATIPRTKVAQLRPSDLKLLKRALGDPLPSVKEANQRALAIDAYVRTLAPLPYEDSEKAGPPVRRPGVTEVDGVALEVTEQRVEMSRSVADFVEISPIPDVTWAGATVTGASVRSGALAPIALDRAAGWITVTTDLTTDAPRTQSSRLEKPDLRTCGDALNTLISELKPTDSAAAMSFRVQQISTLEEAMVSFGLNLKGAGWGVDAKAQLNSRLERSTTFGMFSQAYFQVAFTPDGSPPRFFADEVTLEQVKTYVGPDNPPCYISSITYGRMLTFLVDSAKSYLDVKAAIKGSWSAAVSGDVNLRAEYANTLANSSVTALVVGGSSGEAGEIIHDPANALVPWIKAQLTISSELPVSPIQYTVRYLAPPHNLVRVSRVTSPVRIVDANVYGGREVAAERPVGEGPGRGPVATGLRLNRGDEVTITAQGSIWAGWTFIGRNGPEGLDGPPKPWYPLPAEKTADGQVVRGSMLIGGWDNANWFPIGSGKRLHVPSEHDDAELWLRLNDNDMSNGNGEFSVRVSVRRRMPTINAIPT